MATGKSRNTLSCILKCVTPCLTRRRLIGLWGIGGWQVSDGLPGIYSVCYVLCLCACVLAEVRDTGQRGDTSGWHPVKASWQRVVILPSGSHTPLRSQISRFTWFFGPYASSIPIKRKRNGITFPPKNELLDPWYRESMSSGTDLWDVRVQAMFHRNRKWHQYVCLSLYLSRSVHWLMRDVAMDTVTNILKYSGADLWTGELGQSFHYSRQDFHSSAIIKSKYLLFYFWYNRGKFRNKTKTYFLTFLYILKYKSGHIRYMQ